MKRMNKAFMCVSVLTGLIGVAVFSTSVSASTYRLRGDVDNNGAVNNTDLTILKQYISKKNPSGGHKRIRL